MFNKKYLKYKKKYLHLKNLKGSGTNNNLHCTICLKKFPSPPHGIDQLTFMHLNNANYCETTCCHTVYHSMCMDEWIATSISLNRCPNCNIPNVELLNNINNHTFVSPLNKTDRTEIIVNRFKEPIIRKERINTFVNKAKEKLLIGLQNRKLRQEETRLEEERVRALEERTRKLEELDQSGISIDIDVNFKWSNGGSLWCDVCEEGNTNECDCYGYKNTYTLTITGDSVESLKFLFTHIHEYLDYIYNEFEPYLDPVVVPRKTITENEYTADNMIELLNIMPDIDLDTVLDYYDNIDLMVNLLYDFPILKDNPQDWNEVMISYV